MLMVSPPFCYVQKGQSIIILNDYLTVNIIQNPLTFDNHKIPSQSGSCVQCIQVYQR